MEDDAKRQWLGWETALGGLLVLLGTLVLLGQALQLNMGRIGWPFFVIVPGLGLLGLGLAAAGRLGEVLATVGGVVTMAGLVLLVQNVTDRFETWAYAWALVVLVGAGIGRWLVGVVRGRGDLATSGGWLIAAGLVAFLVFAVFFEGVVGIDGRRYGAGSRYGLAVLLSWPAWCWWAVGCWRPSGREISLARRATSPPEPVAAPSPVASGSTNTSGQRPISCHRVSPGTDARATAVTIDRGRDSSLSHRARHPASHVRPALSTNTGGHDASHPRAGHPEPTGGAIDTVVEARGLRKAYGDNLAVDGVDLQVRAGEIFGLLGPNGAGKTTTVECLQGLRRRSDGQVRVLGLDPDAHGDQLRRRIGCQLQASALPDRLRVGEALELFSRPHHDALPVAELGRRWGLGELWRRPFAKLSGGQQQRLFIALALVNRPEVVFFDELTTGLDPQARRATWELVRRVRDDGATVVLVTHFMEEAEHLCDRVAIVDRGRIVATGTPWQLVQRTDAVQRVTFTWPDTDLAWLSRVPGVDGVTRADGGVEVQGGGALAIRVAAALAGRGVLPTDFRTQHPNLEEVFLALTGRDLRA